MRQRLALAAALLSDPPLLLLDEPTANLDLESRRQFRELLMTLRDEGKTIILSTHFVEHISDIADRVILLSDGVIALDTTPRELQADAGRHFAVYTNGTAKGDLVAALGAIGIGEERITPVAGGLDAAIQRELERRAKEGLEAR
jgi:ABC-type multidrug transport system ATPase subunit